MDQPQKLKDWFGANLAEILGEKIIAVHPSFPQKRFVQAVQKSCGPLELKDRQTLISAQLREALPADYPEALAILLQVLGPENPEETGMFKKYWWIGPIALFVEKYGLEHFDLSMKAIYEITKRNTGEFAVRPYIEAKPKKALQYLTKWAGDPSFHPRRLASEGLRPRLPWAAKLRLFLDDLDPVWAILERLKEDPSKFVQKSVANHVNDLLKERPEAARAVLDRWAQSAHPATTWIVSHAVRNHRKKEDPWTLGLVRKQI